MSIVSERPIWSTFKKLWVRVLGIMTMFSFPYQVTVSLHRLRGTKVGAKSHIARRVVEVYENERN